MKRNVVVAGWGQITQPKDIDGPVLDPLGLMHEASLRAAIRAGSADILTELDAVMVVRTLSRHYISPAHELKDRLDSTARLTHVSGIGGNSPQTLINMAAGMIARNELDCVLIAGAEAYVQREPESIKTQNALFRGIPPDYPEDDIRGATDLEAAHGMEYPMQGFPLFETALWAESGMDIRSYLMKTAQMWSEFSKTAAANPHAWSKSARTAEEIITPGPCNRMIAFPYTKYMNAFVNVDQGAAVILMSEQPAEKYAAKDRRTVYFLGGGYAVDRQRFMIEKSDFTASPPLKAAVSKALKRSSMSIDELECFDFYSCFPCAVSIAKKMTGIKDNDPRPLTLAGGLGFFGGPGNNYSLHSVAALAEKISTGKRSNGLVTALGWFMHKHAAGIYGCRPLTTDMKNHDIEDMKNPLAGDRPVRIVEQASGTGMIETYTIIYRRDMQPDYALIYGRTCDSLRFIARTRSDPEIFRLLATTCMVGAKVKLEFDSSCNMNIAEPV